MNWTDCIVYKHDVINAIANTLDKHYKEYSRHLANGGYVRIDISPNNFNVYVSLDYNHKIPEIVLN